MNHFKPELFSPVDLMYMMHGRFNEYIPPPQPKQTYPDQKQLTVEQIEMLEWNNKVERKKREKKIRKQQKKYGV